LNVIARFARSVAVNKPREPRRHVHFAPHLLTFILHCLKQVSCALAVFLTANALLAADDKSAATTPPIDPTELPLDQLVKMEVPTVEAASKYKQKTTEAPSSVTIVTADEVKRYGYRTLAEILRSAPGLYTSNDRDYTMLGVRGFNSADFNSRVLLLVDGHRINNSLSDSAYIGLNSFWMWT
jgi:iron complex outermembrane receptor protein